jgi:dihydroxyacetone kinase-like protein
MQELTIQDIKAIILRCKEIMEKNRDYLIDLDSAMGDGDLGLTMTRSFGAACEEVEHSTETDAGKLFMKIGMAMAKAAPSTMGTLIATGFMKGGNSIIGSRPIRLAELSVFFSAFTQGIIDRGKSGPGKKTIIDAMQPAAISLSHSVSTKKTLEEAINDAYIAAKRGVEDSKQMKAEYGRAAYYQEGSIGKQDPGATAGMFMMQGFSETIRQ